MSFSNLQADIINGVPQTATPSAGEFAMDVPMLDSFNNTTVLDIIKLCFKVNGNTVTLYCYGDTWSVPFADNTSYPVSAPFQLPAPFFLKKLPNIISTNYNQWPGCSQFTTSANVTSVYQPLLLQTNDTGECTLSLTGITAAAPGWNAGTQTATSRPFEISYPWI